MILLVLFLTLALTLISIILDSGLWATIWMSAGLLGACFIVGFAPSLDIVISLASHPWLVLSCGLLYFLSGTAWMIARWTLYVYKIRDKAIEAKDAGQHTIRQKPEVIDHKSSLFRWWFYWPFSVLDYVFTDFIRKVFNSIYNKFKLALQKISDRAFEDL